MINLPFLFPEVLGVTRTDVNFAALQEKLFHKKFEVSRRASVC